MSIYCMSDLHGNYKLFIEMLEFINFSKEDELYILGDIFDKGRHVYDIYEYISKNKNIHVLKGNHEQMALDAINNKGVDWMLWFHNNGGIDTYQSFYGNYRKFAHKYLSESAIKSNLMSNVEKYTQKEIIDFCKELPLYKELTVNNQKFLLIHAGILPNVPLKEQHEDDMLWIRELFYAYPSGLDNTIIIFGHTPTYFIDEDKNTKIWVDTKHHDKIGIDGGCYADAGHLNCICLTDMTGYSIASMDKQKSKYKIEI